MDDRIFVPVTEATVRSGGISREQKSIFQERLLYRYLTRMMEGWGVGDFLVASGSRKYALYAVTDLTDLFLRDLEKQGESSRPELICDRNYRAFSHGYRGCLVVSPDELVRRYQSKEIEKVIVMNIFHENHILDELIEKGILLKDLISFASVLYP